MKQVIRVQMIRLAFVYGLVGALVVWQRHFIESGIVANPYLNLLIIAVFLFGAFHGTLSILTLGNEGRALAALREAYDDTVRSDEQALRDPLWRQKRCFEPALRFRRPRLLGSVFDLALDEIRRARTVRISLETMQTLLHVVDRKIVTDRALLGYLSGLCIFLGLIGTFIGLMEMVGSVGGIIGGIASADNANADSIKQLIRDLEAPLRGMATGFSASLFGLFSSLILGLTARFGAQATNSLRDELETWLSTMSRIETEREFPLAPVEAAGGEDSQARLSGVAVAVMGGMQRAGQLVGRAADAIRLLADRQTEQGEVLARICTSLDHASRQHEDVRETLARTASLQEQVGVVGAELRGRLDAAVDRMDGTAARLGEAVAGTRAELSASLEGLSVRQAEALQQSLAAGRRLEDGLRRLEGAQAASLAAQQSALGAMGETVAGLREEAGSDRARTSAAFQRVDEALDQAWKARSEDVQRQQRDVAAIAAFLQRIEDRLADQALQRQAGQQAVEAGLGRIAGAVREGAETIEARLEHQSHSVAAVGEAVATTSHHVGTLAALLEQDQTRASGIEAQAVSARNEALDRLARHQAEIGRVLRLVSDRAEAERDALDSGLRHAIGEGFSEVADALIRSQDSVAQSLSRFAEQMASGSGGDAPVAMLRAELRELRATLEGGLRVGFDELRQGLTETANTLASLAVTEDVPAAPARPVDIIEESATHWPRPNVEELRRMAAAAARATRSA